MQRRQVLRIAATVPKTYCLLSWGRGAVQMSENRNQISDAVQAAFTQNCSYAENLMFSVVGAGLCARPRAVRWKIACVCYETKILFFAVTSYKIQLPYGRAQKSSGFRHPFVRYADISPNRGITRPYGDQQNFNSSHSRKIVLTFGFNETFLFGFCPLPSNLWTLIAGGTEILRIPAPFCPLLRISAEFELSSQPKGCAVFRLLWKFPVPLLTSNSCILTSASPPPTDSCRLLTITQTADFGHFLHHPLRKSVFCHILRFVRLQNRGSAFCK